MSHQLDDAELYLRLQAGCSFSNWLRFLLLCRAASPAPSREVERPTESNPEYLSVAATPVAVATTGLAMPPSSTKAASSLLAHAIPAEVPLLAPKSVAHAGPAAAHLSSSGTALASAAAALKELDKTQYNSVNFLLPLVPALVAIANLEDIFDGVGTGVEFGAFKRRVGAFEVTAKACHMEELSTNDSIYKLSLVALAMIKGLWDVVQSVADQDQRLQPIELTGHINQIKTLLVCLAHVLDSFETGDALTANDSLANIRQDLTSHNSRVEYRFARTVNNNGNITINIGDGEVVNNNHNHNFVVDSTPDAKETVVKALERRHVPEAAYDGQLGDTGCMEGTRVQFLEDSMVCIKNRGGPKVIWIAGMMGTGKTSIATTLCHMLRDDPTVTLGTFFCSRGAGPGKRNDARNIIPTLATVLARQYPAYASAVMLQIEGNNDPDIAHKSIGKQVEHLLAKPFESRPPENRLVVFVIDGLDECSDQDDVVELINALTKLRRSTPVKVLIASRPEMYIRGTSIADTAVSSILRLHEVEPAQVKKDITLYINESFKAKPESGDWHSADDVNDLAEFSGDLFIFASTAVRYILNSLNDQAARLRKVISAGGTSKAVTARLDAIYGLILSEATPSDDLDDDDLFNMRCAVGCILTTRTPLSIQTLADLLTIGVKKLHGSLERLHSVIYIPTDDTAPGVRALHSSFSDYMIRGAASHLRVTYAFGDGILARGCLDVMARRLHFNISHTPSSFEQNALTKPLSITDSLEYACLQWVYHVGRSSQQSSFDAVIKETFRPLFPFWLEVLSVLGRVPTMAEEILENAAEAAIVAPETSQFLSAAKSFVASFHPAISRNPAHIYLSALPFAPKNSLIYQDFAHYCSGVVAVESYEGYADEPAATILRRRNQVTVVASMPDDFEPLVLTSANQITGLMSSQVSHSTMITQLTHAVGDTIAESQAFLDIKFRSRPFDREVIVECNSQTLSDVLATTTNSDLFTAVTNSEDTFIRLWDFGTVGSVTSSLDGSFIVSTSNSCLVHIWDVQTGEAKLTLGSDLSGNVLSVTISSDQQMLAVGYADATVMCWDPHAGKVVKQWLQYQGEEVRAMAFSPDLKRLASGSGDTSVHLWDIAAELPSVLSSWQCEGLVLTLCFSCNGHILAAGDSQGFIHLWDTQNGHRLQDLAQGNLQDISLVRFSPDDRRIVASMNNTFATVWEIATAQEAFKLVFGDDAFAPRIISVAYSPNGKYIVSGAADNTVHLWNAENGQAVATLRGHSGPVRCVAFTADGRSIISGSDDVTIRVWDVEAALSLEARAKCDPLVKLASANLDEDGWLVGPSREPLLWLPAECRIYHMQIAPCSLITGRRRCVVTADEGLCLGENWTACWQGDRRFASV